MFYASSLFSNRKLWPRHGKDHITRCFSRRVLTYLCNYWLLCPPTQYVKKNYIFGAPSLLTNLVCQRFKGIQLQLLQILLLIPDTFLSVYLLVLNLVLLIKKLFLNYFIYISHFHNTSLIKNPSLHQNLLLTVYTFTGLSYLFADFLLLLICCSREGAAHTCRCLQDYFRRITFLIV